MDSWMSSPPLMSKPIAGPLLAEVSLSLAGRTGVLVLDEFACDDGSAVIGEGLAAFVFSPLESGFPEANAVINPMTQTIPEAPEIIQLARFGSSPARCDTSRGAECVE